jgi:hypothetical protein
LNGKQACRRHNLSHNWTRVRTPSAPQITRKEWHIVAPFLFKGDFGNQATTIYSNKSVQHLADLQRLELHTMKINIRVHLLYFKNLHR